jgi:ElaB/YqjD/DUF883 family membrane-anchored ribosome-binding protein
MHTNTHRFENALDTAACAVTHFQEGGAALGRSKDELVQEFRNLISEGEALLKSTTSLSGEALAQAREKFRGKLAEATTRVDALSTAAKEGSRRAIVATDDYVRENPWPAAALAAGLGLVIGALAVRR